MNAPATEYGYWFKPDGEFVPVPRTSHDAVAEEVLGMGKYEAKKAGFVRMVHEPGESSTYIALDAMGLAAFNRLRQFIAQCWKEGRRVVVECPWANVQTWPHDRLAERVKLLGEVAAIPENYFEDRYAEAVRAGEQQIRCNRARAARDAALAEGKGRYEAWAIYDRVYAESMSS